ncbi:MAG: ubiquinol-cytochrome C chaperone, partial [Alphaproteobacteria bacterium]|nr:ubiquinol-cytochrome C chaperone [Alphaproteobacteria bacterium]
MISLFRRNPLQKAAELAYCRIIEQARQPVFFAEIGVPDTIDGRFELICLHAFLFLHRLKGETARAAELGQRVFDAMFADFDRSLREMGTGDLSVGRQVKRMAQAFYGRIDAYERGLTAGDGVLK